LSHSACLIRDYSEEHLKKEPKQEIRNISFSVDSTHYENVPMLSENTEDYFYKFKLKISLLRNSKKRTLFAEGYCDHSVNTGRISSDKTHRCTIIQKDEFKGYFNIKNYTEEMEQSDEFNPSTSWILLNFNKNTIFQVLDDNRETHLNPNDFLSAIVDTQTILIEGETQDAFRKGCPSVFYKNIKSNHRFWNEVALSLIRLSLARPTVTARNLFHLSVLMWDLRAAFLQRKKVFFSYETKLKTNIKNLNNVLNYVAYYFLKHRYNKEPGNTGNSERFEMYHKKGDIDWVLDRVLLLKELNNDSYPKAKKEAQEFVELFIKKNKNDGSEEEKNYQTPVSFILKNNFNSVHVNLNGISTPGESVSTLQSVDWTNGGVDFSKKLKINYWNPLYVPGSQDQNGNDQNFEQSPLTLHWGQLPTFSNLAAHYDSNKKVYFNPEKSLPLFEFNKNNFIQENLEVARLSLSHDPLYDGVQKIDISPLSIGNNPLGTNLGRGYSVAETPYNYEPYLVKKADYTRSLAEFWADGPRSETPPGHWNTLANYVLDRMQELKIPYKWNGEGQTLSQEEFEARMYLVLNGALHDAAVVAWGIKTAYQGGRPITVIRKLAAMAEENEEFAKKLLALSPQLLKMEKATFKVRIGDRYTFANPAHKCGKGLLETRIRRAQFLGQTIHLLKKIKKGVPIRFVIEKNEEGLSCFVTFSSSKKKLWIRSWRGHESSFSADDSFMFRAELTSAEEKERIKSYEKIGVSGSGWILAENWVSYQKASFVTPPFPGFISGHSTFSRAAAEVLAGATGSEYFPGGLGQYPAPKLEFERGPQEKFNFQWATYFDASDQSGVSRVYGGIHASYDDLPARVIGSQIGKAAMKKSLEIFAK